MIIEPNTFKADCVQVQGETVSIVFLGDIYTTEDARMAMYHLEKLIARAEKIATDINNEQRAEEDLPF